MLRRSPRTRLAANAAILAFSAGSLSVACAMHPAEAAATLAALASAVTCATTGTAACQSYTNTSSGIGIAGTSAKGTGMRGSSTSNYGVKGSSSSAIGVFGETASSSATIAGVGGVSTSSSGTGVYGSSTSGDGVFGSSPSGVGVYGTATSGTGLAGATTDGDGIYGSASGTGNGGDFYAASADGVKSESTSGTAFYGYTSTGNGADITGDEIGITARAQAYPLILTTTGGTAVFYVDTAGNVYYHGALQTFARRRGGVAVSEFTPTSSTPSVEDTGTATLVDGSASVRLDPAFAATIDTTRPYRVVVTPNGDTRGLYVAEKSVGGFTVRESQGGRATTTFDYRVVATAFGHAGDRMAFVSAKAAAGPSVPMPQGATGRRRFPG